MIAIALASVLLGGPADSVGRPVGPRETPVGVTAPATDTTPRKRPKAIEISDAYATRLTIHRVASYATIPLFAAEYIAGQALFNADATGAPRPDWARTMHGPLAVALGGLFAVNTVTGSLNWWETRNDGSPGRAWRTAHALLMLASDAGFAYAGSLAGNAKNSQVTRVAHRNWAIGSMAVALASYAMMLDPIRRDK